MTDHFRILVVGEGNIFRSPLAERLLRHQLDNLCGDAAGAFEITSAGVRAVSGAAMSEPAVLELERLGGRHDGFVARQLTREMMQESDLVVTVTRALRSRVLEDEPTALGRTFSLRELAALCRVLSPAGSPQGFVAAAAAHRWAVAPHEHDLPDVLGASRRRRREVADRIWEACGTISRTWSELLAPVV
jgi:protein-tyrosine phosphatase